MRTSLLKYVEKLEQQSLVKLLRLHTTMRQHLAITLSLISSEAAGFAPSAFVVLSSPTVASLASNNNAATATSFIDTELRGAAMKLHTRKQAPKEGQAEETSKSEPFSPARTDYLRFLVDSQHVFQALEDVVNEREELEVLRETGLERTEALEK